MSNFASLRRSTLAAAIVAIALVAALAFASAASAKSFTATKRSDPVPDGCKQNDCSLREAVRAANARPGPDVVLLPKFIGPYQVKQSGSAEDGALDGDIDISNHPLVIRSAGPGKAAIAARGDDERVFEVFDGAPTTFRDLVIRGGVADSGEGGGIRSDADLAVIRSRVVANATNGSHGGGIGLENAARLRLVDSVVARNESAGDGGGIDADEGRLIVLRSRILRNETGGNGGGIYYFSAEPSRIVASTINRNRASSPGGGIRVTASGGDPPLRLVGTTISRNRGSIGGGLSVASDLRATNSTVSLNRADGDGGGILVSGSGANLGLNAVTVARNVADRDDSGGGSGGGLFLDDANLFEVENTLIGLNKLGSGQRNDCDGGPFDSKGSNVLSTLGPAGACQGFDRPSDRVRGNPRIGGLRGNGGPTETIALRPGSIAINRARRATAPPRDQRNRPRGTRKDVGAFERNVGS